MPLISLNEIHQLTRHSREHIRRSLERLPFEEGPRKAKLYQSHDVLTLRLTAEGEAPAITEAESRRQLNLQKIKNLSVAEEVLRRERIPLQIVADSNERIFSNVAGLLKACIGQTFTDEIVQEIFGELRKLGDVLKASPDADADAGLPDEEK